MSTKFNVVFVGAGGINFGASHVPWNHSLRLERYLGDRLNVLAIVEPFSKRAEDVLHDKRQAKIGAYDNTKLFKDISSYQGITPHAVFLGVPPQFRGTKEDDSNLEYLASQKFPGSALFVEKPLSSRRPEYVKPLVPYFGEKGVLVAVGYMLRYLKVTQKLKSILAEKNIVVASTNAWYQSTYASENKAFWWNKSMSCGPIVEQATHLCDLSRYIAGDVNLDSVSALAVEHNETPGHLSSLLIDESAIPERDRIPRVTTAIWKYNSGAVGSLTHSLLLHGEKYETQLSVFADGYSFRLVDLYTKPKLFFRTPESDDEQVYEGEDDPYLNQIEAFVEDVEQGGEIHRILSTFQDAVKTYEFTWRIKDASERK